MSWIIKQLGMFFGYVAGHIFKAWAEERRKHKGVRRQIGNSDEIKDAADRSVRGALLDDGLQHKPKN